MQSGGLTLWQLPSGEFRAAFWHSPPVQQLALDAQPCEATAMHCSKRDFGQVTSERHACGHGCCTTLNTSRQRQSRSAWKAPCCLNIHPEPRLTFWHEPNAELASARWHSLPSQHFEESRQPNLVSATHCG